MPALAQGFEHQPVAIGHGWTDGQSGKAWIAQKAGNIFVVTGKCVAEGFIGLLAVLKQICHRPTVCVLKLCNRYAVNGGIQIVALINNCRCSGSEKGDRPIVRRVRVTEGIWVVFKVKEREEDSLFPFYDDR